MRKMLCLLLMLAMLTPCLPALAEDTDALDVILLSSASIEPLQETLRPGKAVTLRFTSPVDGTATTFRPQSARPRPAGCREPPPLCLRGCPAAGRRS